MILRKWEVRPLDKERAAAFAQTYGVPFFLAMLMNIRGLDDAVHLREFLGEGEPLSDPFLLKDMDKAAARITRAVDNMEKIAVYGDYDADGVTSTAMLYSYLETRGADVIFYIPQREGEGYGMNIGAVEYLKEQGVSLIVTVDNGISSVQEVARANELGIDVVVTDHHRYEEEAEVLSEEICADNEERRRVEAEIAEAAFADIEAKGYMKDRVVVVDGENWHHGVIGIVASRVTERCGKPCMIISRGETEAKGSGRSIEGFSLVEAICACGDLLLKFGGHPMAAGITLKPENIEAFRKRINQYAAEHFPQMPTQTVTLDCKLNPAALSVSMAQSLTQLEPFGNGNPQPVFGLFNMELSNVTPVGGGGHLRLTLEKNGAVITAMRFNTKPEELPYHIGDKIDLAVQLEAREFRGQPSLTVIVRDMKFAAFNTEKNIASLASFEKWQRGEVLSAEDKNRLYPDRACLAAIYRALRTVNGKETDQVRFVSQFGKDMTLGLFKTALLVFEERGLVHSEIADDTFTAALIETSGKTDITRSPVLLALQ